MLHKKFVLDERYPDCTLTTYVSEDTPELKMPPRRAMIVCPGGGYRFLSDRENEPVAKYYFAAGMNVFVLRYSVGEGATNYAPLIQAALAIKHVREHAEEYNIDPDYVFICGFSAGGHLAASSGILWDLPEVKAALGDCPEGINRPTGMVLSYPVITSGAKAHKGSIDRLCGDVNASEEERRKYSLELYVNETTPPAFIWHTFSDKTVPVENSLMLADAMTKSQVPFELHIFPAGVHGLSLANKETWSQNENKLVPHVQCWAELSLKWIKEFSVQ